jgi:hypothetical protein
MRALADNQELARKLAALERGIKARLDVHESAIVDTLRRLMEIIAGKRRYAGPGRDGRHEREVRHAG